MQSIKILTHSHQVILADKVSIADTYVSRMKGLLGRSGLSPGEALIIRSCHAVHTLFMRFPIDVVFLTSDNTVVRIIPALSPFRFSPVVYGASSVIELAAGAASACGLKVGDILSIS